MNGYTRHVPQSEENCVEATPKSSPKSFYSSVHPFQQSSKHLFLDDFRSVFIISAQPLRKLSSVIFCQGGLMEKDKQSFLIQKLQSKARAFPLQQGAPGGKVLSGNHLHYSARHLEELALAELP